MFVKGKFKLALTFRSTGLRLANEGLQLHFHIKRIADGLVKRLKFNLHSILYVYVKLSFIILTILFSSTAV